MILKTILVTFGVVIGLIVMWLLIVVLTVMCGGRKTIGRT